MILNWLAMSKLNLWILQWWNLQKNNQKRWYLKSFWFIFHSLILVFFVIFSKGLDYFSYRQHIYTFPLYIENSANRLSLDYTEIFCQLRMSFFTIYHQWDKYVKDFVKIKPVTVVISARISIFILTRFWASL